MIFALWLTDIPGMSHFMCFHFCWHSLLEQVFNALVWAMEHSSRLRLILKFLTDPINVKSH